MKAPSSYGGVVKGSLKLKGKGLLSQKSKKGKAPAEIPATTSAKTESDVSPAFNRDTNSASLHTTGTTDPKLVTGEMLDGGLTTAEKAFRLAQKRREHKRTSAIIDKTHRARMEAFNAHLATLSEHFDTPKVAG